MQKTPDTLLKLSAAVVNMETGAAEYYARKAITEKLNIHEAIEYGLIDGMRIASELYEQEEYFIPELLLCSEAMNAALAVFKEILPFHQEKGRIVIGTIFGDTHDIGKNIVALILEGAGYRVLDLGRDVPACTFVDRAVDFQADVIAISTLMTTTMRNMRAVIELLNKEDKRHLFKVIIGGKPVSPALAKAIGADGYSASAAGALKLIERFCKKNSVP